MIILLCSYYYAYYAHYPYYIYYCKLSVLYEYHYAYYYDHIMLIIICRATDIHRLLCAAIGDCNHSNQQSEYRICHSFFPFAVQAKDHSQQLHARGQIKNQRKPQPPPRRWRRGAGGTKAYT